MKEGRTIIVNMPCFAINTKTYDLFEYSDSYDYKKIINCETLSFPFPEPKEDEILYLLRGFPNRGYLIKVNEQGYEKIRFEKLSSIVEESSLNNSEPDQTQTTSEKIQNITNSLNRLLQTKNKNYGNSALSPLGIFNKNNSTEGIKVRLDDKLMRVKNSDILRKNDIADIMGYLVLLCMSEGWSDFDELMD